jgi:hypothetical protein
MVLEVLTILKKEFAACIIKISSWTTLKMKAAGSSEMLVNVQIDVVSYPRRPVSSILNNFVTVVWHCAVFPKKVLLSSWYMPLRFRQYVSPKFCTPLQDYVLSTQNTAL